MLKQKLCFALVFAWLVIPNALSAAQILTAAKIEGSIVIDGSGDDALWDRADELVTHDHIADVDMRIKCVYSDTHIYFLVSYPDPDESRSHKPWVWSETKQMYEMGHLREDTFVLKWATSADISDLSVHADVPYTADIWFWKACRTDPAGYADDKIQILSPGWTQKAKEIRTKTGKTIHLQRLGDKGKPAYRSEIHLDYKGDAIPQYHHQTPVGSRADIRAKGVWRKGHWTIELGRSLNTGQSDDIQFDITKKYLFGASRFEIAGKQVNPTLSQPLYGSGDVSEALFLVFAP